MDQKTFPAKSEPTQDSTPQEIKEQTNEEKKQTIKSKFEEADENFSPHFKHNLFFLDPNLLVSQVKDVSLKVFLFLFAFKL